MKAIGALTGVLAVMVIVVGCSVDIGADGSNKPTPTRTAIRVAHASPDLAAFDVCLNDNRVVSDARFGQITDYAEEDVRGGRQTFRLVDAGASCDDVIGDDITLILGSYDASTIVTLHDEPPIPLEDDVSPVPAGRARMRVINASPDSIEVDVEDAEGLFDLFDDVDYNQADDFAYKVVPAGTYDLQVKPSTDEEHPVALGATRLREGHVYTLFVFGFVDPADDEPEFDAKLVDDGIAGITFRD
jgi:hypothetical protein